MNPFVEQNCTFKGFESGGSWLLENKKTHLLEGIMYAYPKENKVGSWNGDLKITASFDNEWTSNFGDTRQVIHFEYDGKKFYGIYYKTMSDIVRVKELVEKIPSCEICKFKFTNPKDLCACELADQEARIQY